MQTPAVLRRSQRIKLHLNKSDSTPYRSPVFLQETYQQRKSESYHASQAKLCRHQWSFRDHWEKSCIWMNQIQHHTGHQFLCKKHTNSQQRKSQSYHANQAKLSRHQQSFGDHQEKSCIWMNQIQHHTGNQFLCKKHTNSQQRKSQSYHASQAKLSRHQQSFGDHQEKSCIWMNQIQHHTGNQFLCKKHTNSQQRKSESYHASQAKLCRHQQSFGDHQEKSCIWMNQIQHHTGNQFLCKKHTNSQQRKSESYHASQAKLSRHQWFFREHREKSCIWTGL